MLAISLSANQVATGYLTIFSSGLSDFVGAGYVGKRHCNPTTNWHPHFKGNSHCLNSALNQDILVYGSVIPLILVMVFAFLTGRVSAAGIGESQDVADALDLPVTGSRYLAVMFQSLSLPVVRLSVAVHTTMAENMTDGRGRLRNRLGCHMGCQNAYSSLVW